LNICIYEQANATFDELTQTCYYILFCEKWKKQKGTSDFNAINFENIVKNLWAIIEDIDKDRCSGEKNILRSFQNFTK